MDWIERLNKAVDYIEVNLTNDIEIETLAKTSYCSVYEFSRIFSFAANITVSEYIRRRRLSQAVFDIRNGKESIVEISLKYGYESQATFTRAFKELHGQTPAAVRNNGILLKTYPKITFKLIIRGVTEMDFRIEQKESFAIIGWKAESAGGPDEWEYFFKNYSNKITFRAPLWAVGAYKFTPDGSHFKGETDNFPTKVDCIIGALHDGEPIPDGMTLEEFPAGTWVVFPVVSDPGNDATGTAYAKAMTEWFPLSNYKINFAMPYLEVYYIPTASGNVRYDEVWIPVLNK
jgi:AraC-type DNA-binding domain-containing proteins